MTNEYWIWSDVDSRMAAVRFHPDTPPAVAEAHLMAMVNAVRGWGWSTAESFADINKV
jgi:hypothetical protein